jgi:colanic acid biosynthesis glycosyl transferase WcaI
VPEVCHDACLLQELSLLKTNSMKILICGINYAPDLTGIGKYTGEMGSWLAKNGHTVDVITGMPYYPQWQINSAYRKKWWHKEYIDGVRVYRCPLYVPGKVSSAKRIMHEFSFVLSTLPFWTRKLFSKKYDVVISISPPFHLGILPLLYSRLRRTKIVTHVQDLQVDVAKELCMISNQRLLNFMFSMEKFILKGSSAVSTISRGLLKKIKNKGIIAANCLLFPNWVDENMIRPMDKQKSLRHDFGLSQDDKVILYSGNLGEKQGLENIIEAAKSFREDPSVKFVIVGSGGSEMKLRHSVNEARLNNVQFHPLVSYEKLPELLAMADIHLVLQKKNATDLVMPSKLTSILAAGGCPLVTAPEGSTLYKLIHKNKMGIVVEPDDHQMLVGGIRFALDNSLENFRNNSRYYASKYLSKEAILRKWEAILFRLTNNGREKQAPLVLINKHEKATA